MSDEKLPTQMGPEEALLAIYSACSTLVQVHTGDDSRIGFVVHMGARPDSLGNGVSAGEYVDAWRRVRLHLGLPTEPEQAA